MIENNDEENVITTNPDVKHSENVVTTTNSPTCLVIKKFVRFYPKVTVNYYISPLSNETVHTSKSQIARTNHSKSVSFRESVDVWHVHSRARLKEFSKDIWYNSDEFNSMRIDSIEELIANSN